MFTRTRGVRTRRVVAPGFIERASAEVLESEGEPTEQAAQRCGSAEARDPAGEPAEPADCRAQSSAEPTDVAATPGAERPAFAPGEAEAAASVQRKSAEAKSEMAAFAGVGASEPGAVREPSAVESSGWRAEPLAVPSAELNSGRTASDSSASDSFGADDKWDRWTASTGMSNPSNPRRPCVAPGHNWSIPRTRSRRGCRNLPHRIRRHLHRRSNASSDSGLPSSGRGSSDDELERSPGTLERRRYNRPTKLDGPNNSRTGSLRIKPGGTTLA